MIVVKCSQCGKQYQLRDELAGKQAKCKCGQVMEVPQASPAPEPAPPAGVGGLGDLLDEALPPASGGSPLDDALGADLASAPAPATLPRVRRPAKKAGPNRLVIAAIVGGGVLAVVLVGLVVFALVGTGGAPGETTTAKEAAQPGFATPEEAFESQKKAAAAKDWSAQIRAWTPESQERMATSIALVATMLGKSDPEVAEILQRHGVDASLLDSESLQAKPGDIKQFVARAQERQRQLAAAIQDKQAFYVEMMPEIERVGKAWAGKVPLAGASAQKMQAEAEQAQAQAKLVDLQIDGDSASARQSITFQGKSMNVPIHFRRIDGRWYLHQPDLTSQAQAPQPTTE
jgi:hypothetical protein